jgi:P27 family predicted phage terminase small subunit
MRGRKKKPDQLKRLTGTLQKYRASTNVPSEVVDKLPPAPKHFSKTGKKLWRDVGEQCRLLGVLSPGNLTPLAAFCNEMATYMDLSEELKGESLIITIHTEFGSKQVPNPKKKMATDSLRNAMKIATEYGLTPASVGKIGAGGKKEEDDYKKFKDRT